MSPMNLKSVINFNNIDNSKNHSFVKTMKALQSKIKSYL